MVPALPLPSTAFLDFFLNWARSVERLGLQRHVLVFAQDDVTLEFASRLWPGQVRGCSAGESERGVCSCHRSSPIVRSERSALPTFTHLQFSLADVCTRVRERVHTHTRTYTHIHTRTHTRTHTHKHTHTQTKTHTHTHTHICARHAVGYSPLLPLHLSPSPPLPLSRPFTIA